MVTNTQAETVRHLVLLCLTL